MFFVKVFVKISENIITTIINGGMYMSSKTKKEVLIDTNLMSNLICKEVLQEFNYGEELGSALFESATENLISVNAMREFSVNMLKKIELNDFADTKTKKTKALSIEDKINKIQQDIAFDIAIPLQEMFDNISGFVCEAFSE